MKSADLDRLERELGLVGEDDENQIKQSTEGHVIQSVRPSERRAGGCISSLWLCGVFGGCMPALYSCWIADWAILQGDRYAGMAFGSVLPGDFIRDLFHGCLLWNLLGSSAVHGWGQHQEVDR